MGCNCKNVKKLENKLINDNGNIKEKNGVLRIFNKVSLAFKQVLMKLFIILLFIVLTPIVMLVLIITFIFKNQAFFPINGKIVKSLSKLDNI